MTVYTARQRHTVLWVFQLVTKCTGTTPHSGRGFSQNHSEDQGEDECEDQSEDQVRMRVRIRVRTSEDE